MTQQALDKAIDKIQWAKRIREMLDQAVEAGHDEEEILELVTGDDEE